MFFEKIKNFKRRLLDCFLINIPNENKHNKNDSVYTTISDFVDQMYIPINRYNAEKRNKCNAYINIKFDKIFSDNDLDKIIIYLDDNTFNNLEYVDASKYLESKIEDIRFKKNTKEDNCINIIITFDDVMYSIYNHFIEIIKKYKNSSTYSLKYIYTKFNKEKCYEKNTITVVFKRLIPCFDIITLIEMFSSCSFNKFKTILIFKCYKDDIDFSYFNLNDVYIK